MWSYTPHQAESFIWLAERRRKRDRALDLSLAAMAFRAEAKEINRKITRDFADR